MMAYLSPSPAPSWGALLRRHRLPRCRHRLSRAMGKRPSGLGRFPGFPARALSVRACGVARSAPTVTPTVFPVYGPIRYRSPNAVSQRRMTRFESCLKRGTAQVAADTRLTADQCSSDMVRAGE